MSKHNLQPAVNFHMPTELLTRLNSYLKEKGKPKGATIIKAVEELLAKEGF